MQQHRNDPVALQIPADRMLRRDLMRRLRSLLASPLHLDSKARRNARQAAAQLQEHRRAVRAAGIYPDLHEASAPTRQKR